MLHLDVVEEIVFGGKTLLADVAGERRQRRVVRPFVVAPPHVRQPLQFAGKFHEADLKSNLKWHFYKLELLLEASSYRIEYTLGASFYSGGPNDWPFNIKLWAPNFVDSC